MCEPQGNQCVEIIGTACTPAIAAEPAAFETITENMENKKMHNTYQFECELFQFVQNGNVNALQNFLKNNTLQLEEGRLAKTPIRHAKNLFIVTAIKTAVLGAIPGGVDIVKNISASGSLYSGMRGTAVTGKKSRHCNTP